MPDKLGKNEAQQWWEFRSALMAVIAFHVGKLSGGIACDRLCRALDMPSYEQRPQRHNHDGPEVWPLVLEKLNTRVAARGGRPIAENGSQ